MKQKIYCSQCHKSAFCDVGHGQYRRRKLWCQHLHKFIPLKNEIGTCTGVVYENRQLLLSGAWQPSSYNPAKCSTKST